MSDAPRSADAGNGKAVETKKKFEVKKVRRAPALPVGHPNGKLPSLTFAFV